LSLTTREARVVLDIVQLSLLSYHRWSYSLGAIKSTKCKLS